jgi:hypothetical protein
MLPRGTTCGTSALIALLSGTTPRRAVRGRRSVLRGGRLGPTRSGSKMDPPYATRVRDGATTALSTRPVIHPAISRVRSMAFGEQARAELVLSR